MTMSTLRRRSVIGVELSEPTILGERPESAQSRRSPALQRRTGVHPVLPLNAVISNAWFHADPGRSRAPDRTAGVDPERSFGNLGAAA